MLAYPFHQGYTCICCFKHVQCLLPSGWCEAKQVPAAFVYFEFCFHTKNIWVCQVCLFRTLLPTIPVKQCSKGLCCLSIFGSAPTLKKLQVIILLWSLSIYVSILLKQCNNCACCFTYPEFRFHTLFSKIFKKKQNCSKCFCCFWMNLLPALTFHNRPRPHQATKTQL